MRRIALGELLRRVGLKRIDEAERRGLPVEATPEDYAILKTVRDYTMTSEERIWALLSSIVYVSRNRIEGDIVECGCWRGGSCMAAALKLLELRDCDRTIWMYDTFMGMTKPTSADQDVADRPVDTVWQQNQRPDGSNAWCFETVHDVEHNMKGTGYPSALIRLVQGPVELTLSEDNATNQPAKIALLRLDTDWYESTKVELERLFPRLTRGSILIIDDYGYWKGARKAVDEYFLSRGLFPLLQRIDGTARLVLVT